MNVIFAEEISKAYGDKVAEMIGRGLTAHVATMGGSQGEFSHFDLTDGKDVYRVLLDGDREMKDGFHSFETVVLSVRRYEDFYKDTKMTLDSWSTIWNQKGEEVYRKVYYKIASRRNKDVYVATREEALECENRSLVHYKNSRGDDGKQVIHLSDSQKKRLAEIVKGKDGYKSVRWNKIDTLEIMRYVDYRTFKVTFSNQRKDLLLGRI